MGYMKYLSVKTRVQGQTRTLFSQCFLPFCHFYQICHPETLSVRKKKFIRRYTVRSFGPCANGLTRPLNFFTLLSVLKTNQVMRYGPLICRKLTYLLTCYHTVPHFHTLRIYNCGKHCEKRRNCL